MRRAEEDDAVLIVNFLRPFAGSSNRDTLNLLGLSELCLGHREAARGFLERSLALATQTSVREALAFIDRGR